MGDVVDATLALELAGHLAERMVEQAAPEELPMFDTAAEAYFSDPKWMTGKDRSDDLLAFTVGDIVPLVTPVALAAAAVAGLARRHRPALIMLATSMVMPVAVLGMFWVNLPISKCIDLYGVGTGQCFVNPDGGFLARTAAHIAVTGVVASAPAALIGAAVGGWLRCGRTAASDHGAFVNLSAVVGWPRQAKLAATVAIIGLLVAANAMATLLGVSDAYEAWIAWNFA